MESVSGRGINFNPLRREGGDAVGTVKQKLDNIFQSTPPRGRRRPTGTYRSRLHNFNPLRREGGDGLRSRTLASWEISIHSAARAETLFLQYLLGIAKISIHSAARAETNQDSLNYHEAQDFNPLRREGGDRAPR